MNPQDQSAPDPGLSEQAASWLLTLQSEELSSAQRAEFVDWLRQSPQHISEMLRVCQLQRDLAGYKGWDKSPVRDNVPISKVVQLVVNAGSRPRRDGHPYRPALRVAGVVIACIAGLLLLARPDQTEFRTEQGERREMTLADGSVVKMAPVSDVVVQYRARERLILLRQGEAQFRVMKDPNRPFIVQAALTRVRAVGTVFDVEYSAKGVSVSVVEGRVAVSQRGARTGRGDRSISGPEGPVLSLEASEQVSITPAGIASSVRRAPANAEVAWASDQLTFDNETVAEVTQRFNRSNVLQIEIADSDLATRRISGVFNVSDPQSFVAFIEAAAHAHVRQADTRHIIIGSDRRQ